MALMKWNPFGETHFPALGEDMERLLEDFFRTEQPRPKREERITPPLDVYETPEKVVVNLDIPGIDPEQVSITITGDKLSVKGERKREESRDDQTYYHTERIYGEFQRIIDLPVEVAADSARAYYRNGVLRVEVSKSEKAVQKEIRIEIK
jgi:HSP20 family protein